MVIKKIKPQKIEVIKKNQPDLHLFINTFFDKETDDLKGRIAGAIIEWVILSGGNVAAFNDEVTTLGDEWNEEFD